MTNINGTTRAYGFNPAGQRATTWDASGNLLSAQYGGLAYWLALDGHVRFQHQHNLTIQPNGNGPFFWRRTAPGVYRLVIDLTWSVMENG